MSYRDAVLSVAYDELALPVHWKEYENSILFYFLISTGKNWTRKSALTISWCSYFVHFVLFMAGVTPLPQVGTKNAIGRFMKGWGGVYDIYSVGKKNYAPQPGDMYNKPHPNNHIGFISDVQEAGNGRYMIKTIDGNSGPDGWSPFYFGTKIGNGFIYQPDHWRKLTDDCSYIALPD